MHIPYTSQSLLAAIALLPCMAYAQPSITFPDDIQQANILHCFDWTFADIEEELPRIAEAGFGAVQISPVQGNCGENAEWYYAYMPYDFAFVANGSGTREQLQQLCATASEYGIKIIVDVVANHINAHPSYRDGWWNNDDYQRFNGGINYNSRYSITHGQLGDYGDVNSEHTDVQARAKAFIEDLASLGVKGIRWDAAKHIALPSEGCGFWPAVTSVAGLWHYGEILDNPAGGNASSEAAVKLLNEYAQYMSVTDSEYAATLLSSVKSWILPSSEGNLSARGVAPDKLVYWGESHDTFANDGGATKGTNQNRIDRVYLLNACRKDATALYFSRPPETSRTRIRMCQKGSVHALEAPEIAAVNRFRIAMGERDEAFTRTTGTAGVVCIARKDGGAVIIGKKPAAQEADADNSHGFIPDGTYTDILTGNSFTAADGRIKGKLGDTGIAVIYADGSASAIGIETDDFNLTTEYYDLTGRRVTNPASGFYIKRTGNKTTKIIL